MIVEVVAAAFFTAFAMVIVSYEFLPAAIILFVVASWTVFAFVALYDTLVTAIAVVPTGVVAYLAVGVVWSVLRWWFYVRARTLSVAKQDYFRSSFADKYGKPAADSPTEFLDYCLRYGYLPSIESKRRSLAVEALLWPFSILYNVTKKPLSVILSLYSRLYAAAVRRALRIGG